MPDKLVALNAQHIALGAKMVPFAGFSMPIQYSSIIEEHLAVRNGAGIFDVSHMGEFEIKGTGAEAFLNHMTVNNVEKLEVGQVQYSAMLYDNGGVVDDLLVYRFSDHFLLVVNASNIKKDWDWLFSHKPAGVEMNDHSDDTTLLAIQGPKAIALVKKLTDVKLDDIVYYHYGNGQVGGVHSLISRTGYTGEDGFELYCRRADSVKLWNAIWEAGKPLGLMPVGLGCRDSLRLESAFCLYGNDIDQSTNPIEAGLSWIVKSKKPGGFIGIETVLKAKEGTTRRLAGFKLEGKAIGRHGAEVFSGAKRIGVVTSGGYSPVLEGAIGLAYIDKPYDAEGAKIEIDQRGKRVSAVIVPTPFYKRG